jgi:hypothetical protein
VHATARIKPLPTSRFPCRDLVWKLLWHSILIVAICDHGLFAAP